MKLIQKCFGSILLIAGTAIGAGMLALPSVTANSGFIPSVIIFAVTWFFMTLSAFYLAEITLMLEGEVDLVSMSEKTLGRIGKWVTILIYLTLFYALISAYLKGGASWVLEMGKSKGFVFNHTVAMFAIAVIFGSTVCYGTQLVDQFNRLLTFGLFVTYVSLVLLLAKFIDLNNLTKMNFANTIEGLPIVITAFGFSVVIPAIGSYLDKNDKALKRVVFLGSFLPLIIYLIWEVAILGVIPTLAGGSGEGISIANTLKEITENKAIFLLIEFFAIFALFTSFLGVSLGLFHFTADLLNWQINHKTRLPLLLFTYLPAFGILFIYPKAFEQILAFGGSLVAILLGILPACMIVRLKNRIPGGKMLLILNVLFFTSVIVQRIFQ